MGYALKEDSDHRVKPDGGYIHVSTFRFGVAWWCYLAGTLSLRAVRILLALHEAGIERSAYVWTEKKRGRGVPEFTPRFSVEELASFCGLPVKRARAALKELLDLGLLAEFLPERITFARTIDELRLSEDERSEFWEWSALLTNRKRVPMPRRILALACETSSPAQIAFIWSASLRCVYLHPKGVGFTYSGWLKLTWLSRCMDISLSSLKAAKSHLVKLGWIEPTGKVCKHGEKLSVNPAWERIQETAEGTSTGTKSGCQKSPSGAKSGPPKTTRESSAKAEIQKPRESPSTGADPGPGIFKNPGEPTPKKPDSAPPVRLSAIKPEDFQDVGRALELFRQATVCKLVEDSEHSRVRWLAGIERARTVQANNPAGVFLHLVKNRLWSYLSEGHWDAASERLKTHLYGANRLAEGSPLAASIGRRMEPRKTPEQALSGDAKLVQAIRTVLRQRGVRNPDPIPYLRSQDSSWNRERLLAAELELSRPNYLEAR
jgi:hypothetical protein